MYIVHVCNSYELFTNVVYSLQIINIQDIVYHLGSQMSFFIFHDEPAQRDFDGSGEAGSEEVRRQVR